MLNWKGTFWLRIDHFPEHRAGCNREGTAFKQCSGPLQTGGIGLDFSKPQIASRDTYLNLATQHLYGIINFTPSFSSPTGVCVLSPDPRALVLIF